MKSNKVEGNLFTVIDAGVDWLTATSKAGLQGRPFRDLQEQLIHEERAAGGDVIPATLRDYVGRRSKHLYCGTRREDAIIVTSGQHAPDHWQSIAEASDNVSRIDLQVSLWTHGEQPDIARRLFSKAKRLPPTRGHPRTYSLIQSHPHGETLYVGKRTSDHFGRVYDWSSAHKAGEEKTVWRFEVEAKRRVAKAYCNALVGTHDVPTHTSHLVYDWFLDRNLRPSFKIDDGARFARLALSPRDTDLLGWMESSLSKTVARAISTYGMLRVLHALGLLPLIQKHAEELKDYGAQSTRPLPSVTHRGAAWAAHHEHLLLSDEEQQPAHQLHRRSAKHPRRL